MKCCGNPERTEKMMVRWMCGVTLKNRITSEELRNRLSIEAVTEIVRRGRLRWFGHVERKADDDWVKKCSKVEVVGKVGRGRSSIIVPVSTRNVTPSGHFLYAIAYA